MHLHRKVWRNFISAAALVSLALPLAAAPLATPASAQTTAGPTNVAPAGCVLTTATSTGNCIAGATLSNGAATAFNPIGNPDTATFVCDAGVISSGLVGTSGATAAGVAPGCYDVTATVSDTTTGNTAPIQSATCGDVAANPNGGNVDCSGVASPICPVGFAPAPAPTTTTPCATTAGTTGAAPAGYIAGNTATVTIDPGAPHAYLITFTGYVPTTALGSCPAGTTLTPAVSVTVSTGFPPASTVVPLAAACQFSVSVQKKYVEITKITLTTPTSCGGTIIFAEGLKSYFGPACPVSATATGTVILKTGVDCTTEPPNGTDANNPINGIVTDFPVGSTYECQNGTLSVVGIPVTGVPLTFTTTGSGSFTSIGTLGSYCAGSSTTVTNTVPSGTVVSVCPTGPGSVSIAACYTSTLNSQAPICSSSFTFAYKLYAARAVPYVRWAGEKIVLTKCFGIGLAGAPVEFTMQGNNDGLNATLLPVSLNATSAPNPLPTADTIWTTTDTNGCASVIGYAAGEGVMYVDAAIYSTTSAVTGTAAGAIVNEHAFEVFYLKFDHIDLENIAFQTYATAQALNPYLSWMAPATMGSATTFPTSFMLPGPPSSGHVAGTPDLVPICQLQYVRAMVHGYFELPGDPSGRPASTVAIPGAPAGSAGSYVLPAGRWVLPEDWPLLATFAGFSSTGSPFNVTPSSVLAWDLNSGWVFNPTAENPVFCVGNSLEPGTYITNGGVSAVDLGPCAGRSTVNGSNTTYTTAPDGICAGGATVGIGPFDPTQACTNPFPLDFTPAGASVIGTSTAQCGTTPAPCLASTGPNSTYLPNETLNEWDAPMPPAQVSFGITSGPGFLNEVDKTGLYALTFDLGAPASGASCATGYVPAPAAETTASGQSVAKGDCILEVNPNPFYAEAIPASPIIPPVTNNGGYLWDSWHFSGGVTTIVRSTGAFPSPAGATANTNPAPGGFVPGQSTSAVFTAAAGTTITCPSAAAAASCTVRGGTEISCSTTPTNSVVVADARGFMVGQTVEVLNQATNTLVTSGGATVTATISAILPMTTATTAGFPNAAELVLSGPIPCTPSTATTVSPYVVESTALGLPVPGAAAFTVGSTIVITTPTGASTTATILAIDTTNNIVYVDTADGIAVALGCSTGVSQTNSGAAGGPLCEPASIVPPGTVLTTFAPGATVPVHAAPPNPYPFWQWLSGQPATGATPTSATVYSDNHGEAVVSLDTAIASQVLPVSGACPTNYQALTINGTVVNCQLSFAALGPLGFSNVATALSGFSAAKPGCIATYPSGTTAVLTGATIGATGPAPGQICINSLGGIEFGAAASLGSTTVQAVADYPYTRGEHPMVASAPLVKVFTSAFAKTLSVSAAAPGPAGTTSYTVTITATDVCGLPLNYEPIEVLLLGNAGAAALAPITFGTLLSNSGNSTTLTVNPSTGTATLSLEVLNTAVSTQGLVVKAIFSVEGIERFATVIPGTAVGQTVSVVYAPGWQQVGGPAGSNFSVAEAMFSWDAGAQSYTNATASAGNISSAPPLCTGYWAYFAAAMTVSLPATSKSGDTATCTLAKGWNLVGNPFASAAKIPSGVTAYHWNGTSYDTVGTIPVGGSAWIFNDGTLNSIILTAT